MTEEKICENMGMFKNLWRRKCVRRGIFPSNPYFVCNTSNCVTVRLVRGNLTPKMNIAFFYQKFDAEYFFIQQCCIFGENRKKSFWRGAFDNFLGKEGVLGQKLFYHKWGEVLNILLVTNFFQKCVIFWENDRKPGPSLFWRKGSVWRREWI